MKQKHVIIAALCCIIHLLSTSFGEARRNGNVLYEVESPYHHITVVERENGRYRDLVFGRLLQSTMEHNDPLRLVYPYAESALLSLTMVPKVERVLFIGMGAGTLSNVFKHHYPDVEVDIVDIDPYVFDVAGKYFHFTPDSKTRTIVKDGRVFLRKTDKQYDLIFLDSFNEEGVPFHLTTKEFLEIAKSRLTPNGCFVNHLWGTQHNKFFSANVRTNQEVFGDVYLLDTAQLSDYVLVATADNRSLTKAAVLSKAGQLMQKYNFSFDLVYLARRQFVGKAEFNRDEMILTDDYAPVNILRYQEAR